MAPWLLSGCTLIDTIARPQRQKRIFDVGHTSSGMTFGLRCSIRLRLRSWGA
jgi:hypothetical protein